jgi:hypothetical protein
MILNERHSLHIASNVWRDVSFHIVTSLLNIHTSLINIAGDVWMLPGDVIDVWITSNV